MKVGHGGGGGGVVKGPKEAQSLGLSLKPRGPAIGLYGTTPW